VIATATAAGLIAIVGIGIGITDHAPLVKKVKIQVQIFYYTNMIIVKLENGNVEIQGDDAQGYECLQPNARLKRDDANQVIRVIYAQNNIFTIKYSQVTALQIAPAAVIPFTGTFQELFDELKANFFFDSVGSSTSNALVYRAYLYQIGTFDPVATVLENTLGGTLVWTRDAVGEYLATLAGAFPDFAKIFFNVYQSNSTDDIFANENNSDSLIFVSNAGIDGTLRAYVEIRVYP